MSQVAEILKRELEQADRNIEYHEKKIREYERKRESVQAMLDRETDLLSEEQAKRAEISAALGASR